MSVSVEIEALLLYTWYLLTLKYRTTLPVLPVQIQVRTHLVFVEIEGCTWCSLRYKCTSMTLCWLR